MSTMPSTASFCADHDVTDRLHEHRRAVLHLEHDVADVLQRADAAEATHVVELSTFRVESAAGIRVIGAERRGDISRGKTGSRELCRIEQYLVFHRLAAQRREIGHAGHRAVLLVEHPVLQNLELHRGAVRALEHVSIHEARWRRERGHAGRHTRGDRDVRNALKRLLSREVVVRSVLEREPDIGEAVQGDRARHLELRQSAHPVLDGHRDESLDFLGRMARPLRDDLHHRRRDVRVCVHRESRERPHTRGDDRDGHQQDEEWLPERRADDAMHHRRRRVRLELFRDIVGVDVSRQSLGVALVRARHWLPAN
jgi:hypothetical protein